MSVFFRKRRNRKNSEKNQTREEREARLASARKIMNKLRENLTAEQLEKITEENLVRQSASIHRKIAEETILRNERIKLQWERQGYQAKLSEYREVKSTSMKYKYLYRINTHQYI